MNTQSRAGLSPDLASLIHHVELSRAGWRDEAFSVLLLSIMDRHGDPLSLDTLCALVNQSVPASVSQLQVKHFLDVLISRQNLLKLPNGHFKLSEQARDQCVARADSNRALTEAARRRFEISFRSLDGNILDWNRFHREFLIPLVTDLGARTYELVTGTEAKIRDVPAYQQFVSSVSAIHRAALSDGLVGFFDPSAVETRKYMLRLLNNAFLAQAIALPDRAMNRLLERTRRPLRVRVFVDTNFMFSLLGLHDSPADDIVRTLHDVIGQMPGRLDVKFYVLPFTVAEARKTLMYYFDRLSRFHMSREVARAIDNPDSGVSSIVTTYARNAYKDGKRISAADYLSPYLNDFIRVARDHGIELFNEDVQHLSMDEDVIDDINEQMEQQKQRPQKRQKSYEVMCHDMMLWHFVRRRRPLSVDSPLDAEAWVATIDYGLLAFDAAKRDGREPPVCIHPTSLLQMLQLWVPSSDRLVGALMESLHPVLPRTFGHRAEKISIRIAEVLSRFEIGDLTEETVSDIFLDEAVRTRIGATTNHAEDEEIIQSAIAKANTELIARLKETESRIERERERAVALEIERDHEKAKRRELASQLDTLVHNVAGRKARQSDMEKQVAKLQRQIEVSEHNEKKARRRAARRRVRIDVTLAVLSSIVTVGGGLVAWQRIELVRSLTWIHHMSLLAIVAMLSIGVFVGVIKIRMGGLATGTNSKWIARITGWSGKVWGALGIVVLGLITAVLFSLF